MDPKGVVAETRPLVASQRTRRRYQSLRRSALTAFAILAAGSLVTVYAAPGDPRTGKSEFQSPVSCNSQYNADLDNAKSALLRNDRAAAIAALTSAKAKLDRCVEREHESSTGAQSLSFDWRPLFVG